jgi:hypothetical protein
LAPWKKVWRLREFKTLASGFGAERLIHNGHKAVNIVPCQGCQIFLDTIYQNVENIPNAQKVAKRPLNVPNSKIFQNIPTCSIQRSTKINRTYNFLVRKYTKYKNNFSYEQTCGAWPALASSLE